MADLGQFYGPRLKDAELMNQVAINPSFWTHTLNRERSFVNPSFLSFIFPSSLFPFLLFITFFLSILLPSFVPFIIPSFIHSFLSFNLSPYHFLCSFFLSFLISLTHVFSFFCLPSLPCCLHHFLTLLLPYFLTFFLSAFLLSFQLAKSKYIHNAWFYVWHWLDKHTTPGTRRVCLAFSQLQLFTFLTIQ